MRLSLFCLYITPKDSSCISFLCNRLRNAHATREVLCIMSTLKYTRIADDVSLDASQVDLAPALTQALPRSRRRFVLTLVTIFALLLVLFYVTSPRSEPTPYNPLPSSDDKSFNSTSLPVVMWHGMGDSCCATWSIGALQKTIQEILPGQIALDMVHGSYKPSFKSRALLHFCS